MALHWDVTKCYKDGFDPTDEQEWPATHAMIWYMMTVGFSAITQDNWQDVFARLLLWQRMFDPDGVKVTPEVVYDRIGLSTNCNNETDAQWRKRMYANFMREERYNAQDWAQDWKESA